MKKEGRNMYRVELARQLLKILTKLEDLDLKLGGSYALQ